MAICDMRIYAHTYGNRQARRNEVDIQVILGARVFFLCNIDFGAKSEKERERDMGIERSLVYDITIVIIMMACETLWHPKG